MMVVIGKSTGPRITRRQRLLHRLHQDRGLMCHPKTAGPRSPRQPCRERTARASRPFTALVVAVHHVGELVDAARHVKWGGRQHEAGSTTWAATATFGFVQWAIHACRSERGTVVPCEVQHGIAGTRLVPIRIGNRRARVIRYDQLRHAAPDGQRASNAA